MIFDFKSATIRMNEGAVVMCMYGFECIDKAPVYLKKNNGIIFATNSKMKWQKIGIHHDDLFEECDFIDKNFSLAGWVNQHDARIKNYPNRQEQALIDDILWV